MIIGFTLDHVFSPSSSQEEDAEILRILMESLVMIDRVYVRRNRYPGLYHLGITYGRTRSWDPIPTMVEKRYGDCKSLAAARIAELREQGQDANPEFRFRVRPDGRKDFHILVVKNEGGRIVREDPSRILGMGADENQPIRRTG